MKSSSHVRYFMQVFVICQMYRTYSFLGCNPLRINKCPILRTNIENLNNLSDIINCPYVRLPKSSPRPLRTLVNLLLMLVWESGIELPELTLVSASSAGARTDSRDQRRSELLGGCARACSRHSFEMPVIIKSSAYCGSGIQLCLLPGHFPNS